MEFNPQKQLEGMRETISQYYKEIASWDKPVSGFTKVQQFDLGNLCVELENVEERFNTAIESFD